MAKAKVQMSTEFTEIKTTVSELARKVNAIRKELKEQSTSFTGQNYFLQIAK